MHLPRGRVVEARVLDRPGRERQPQARGRRQKREADEFGAPPCREGPNGFRDMIEGRETRCPHHSPPPSNCRYFALSFPGRDGDSGLRPRQADKLGASYQGAVNGVLTLSLRWAIEPKPFSGALQP